MTSSTGAHSNYMFNTNRPQKLPVTDVSLWLGGTSGEAVAIDFGAVCFSR